MCGIAGLISQNKTIVSRESLNIMGESIKHRGPDDSGTWISENGQVGLVHRRLSIIDLSPEGHQPMMSSGGRYLIAFNGEIYNYESLREHVNKVNENAKWHGSSDTEVILELIELYGFEKSLEYLNGMFAIALYDKYEDTLYLARDRMGEKPLYYGLVGSTFVFASELKSIKTVFGELKIDRDSLALYLRHGYVPSPWSIYEGIRKLNSSHYIKIQGTSILGSCIDDIQQISYWSLVNVARDAKKDKTEKSYSNYKKELDTELKKAVALRMRADVPLGAFLSGGYDSSLVVAMMNELSDKKVKTYSIGFNEEGYNEAAHAKQVAKHLGTEHTECYITPKESLDVIPKLPSMYCEPFADSSQIPTYLVSALAKSEVTVALSGDGGDELFCGYNRYIWSDTLWRKLKVLSPKVRSNIARVIEMFPPTTWNTFLKLILSCAPKRYKVSLPGDKLHKLANIIGCTDEHDLYFKLVSIIQKPSDLLTHPEEHISELKKLSSLNIANMSYAESIMLKDSLTYMPEDILTKVDRASMAVSLEARVPLLDHNLVEFAWQIPQQFKLKEGNGKFIFKDVLHNYVPKDLMERPKMGFGVPIDSWLRNELKIWAEELLSDKLLDSHGLFHKNKIQKMWKEHLSLERNWSHQLWIILMFQSWFSDNK